ncbi:MAG: protein kinase [Verrucomicrobia bacterium]|nr:protein kinase [Verrucomicrobiota bacterium]
MKEWLLQVDGTSDEPLQFILPRGVCRIGTRDDVEIRFDDSSVAPLHALIEIDDNQIPTLTPQSDAPVTRNGVVIEDAVRLEANDQVAFGEVSGVLLFEETDEADVEPDNPPTAATRFVADKQVAAGLGRGGPQQAGPYTLLDKISDGGQAVIYKARHRETGDVVAVKLFKAAGHEEDGDRRFYSEVSILKSLDHHNIVRCIDTVDIEDEWGGLRRGLVMEYLEGTTLKQWVADHPRGMPWERAREILDQALQGLQAAFDQGIVHRDIKPSNIILLPDGTVKLIDFGVAHAEEEESQTKTGMLGSFDYMAPEFAVADTAFHGDVVSDIFGLFVCFYEMLTGRLPYPKFGERADLEYLSRWKTKAPPVSHAPIVFRVVAHLSKFVDRGLSVDRENRFQSYAEVREELKSLSYRLITHEGKDQYELLDGLGAGAFGEVYKARRKSDGMLVAIKRLFPDRSGEKFVKEAKVLAKSRHPGIVEYQDFFQSGGDARTASYFLVMDYLDGMPGCSLRDRIKDNPAGLPLAEVIPMFLRYTAALGHLHFEGIIHRDIKPANLYAPAGKPENACIMDLGVARDLTGTKTTGNVPGSWDFMAPELLIENARGAPRSDLFALGLSLYEAITGGPAMPRLPRDDREAYPELLARANGTSKHTIGFSDSVFEVYPELASLVKRMCSRSPSERPNDAHVVYEELLKLGSERFKLDHDAWAAAAPPALPEAPVEDLPEIKAVGETSKSRTPVVLALLILLAAAGGGGWWWLQQQKQAKPQPQVAPATPAESVTAPVVYAPSTELEPEPEPVAKPVPQPEPPPVAQTAAPDPIQEEALRLVRQIEVLHRLYPVSYGYDSFQRDIHQRIREMDGHLRAVTEPRVLTQASVLRELQRFWLKMAEYAVSESLGRKDRYFHAITRESVYHAVSMTADTSTKKIDWQATAAKQAKEWLDALPDGSLVGDWPLLGASALTWNTSGAGFLDVLFASPAGQSMRAKTLPRGLTVTLQSKNSEGKIFRSLELAMPLVPDWADAKGQSGQPFYLMEIEAPIEALRIYRDDARQNPDPEGKWFSGQVDFERTQGEPTRPYQTVGMEEAVEFCNWMSLRAGLLPLYQKDESGTWTLLPDRIGFRLPSVEEWVLAARYGFDLEPQPGNQSWERMKNGLTGDGLVYFLYKDQPRSSAQSPVYPLGFRDLCGNVAEICMEIPVGPEPGKAVAPAWVTKGGHAGSKAAAAVLPEFRPARLDEPGGMVGFRVLLPVPFSRADVTRVVPQPME